MTNYSDFTQDPGTRALPVMTEDQISRIESVAESGDFWNRVIGSGLAIGAGLVGGLVPALVVTAGMLINSIVANSLKELAAHERQRADAGPGHEPARLSTGEFYRRGLMRTLRFE